MDIMNIIYSEKQIDDGWIMPYTHNRDYNSYLNDPLPIKQKKEANKNQQISFNLIHIDQPKLSIDEINRQDHFTELMNDIDIMISVKPKKKKKKRKIKT